MQMPSVRVKDDALVFVLEMAIRLFILDMFICINYKGSYIRFKEVKLVVL